MKESLPVSGADILLLTPEEARSNFENHNPLFLDIAEEGILLFDETGSILQLMGETRRYIRKRGIRRYRGGWMFPVEQGRPTPLSRVTNADFSRAMLKDGERDLEIGKQLTRAAFYDKAVYHFQQASEEAVKGILIALGVFQKTHFVGEILMVTKRPRKRGGMERRHALSHSSSSPIGLGNPRESPLPCFSTPMKRVDRRHRRPSCPLGSTGILLAVIPAPAACPPAPSSVAVPDLSPQQEEPN